MYLTLEEFEAAGGKSFDVLSEFDALCLRAQTYVDYYTQGRLKREENVPDGVKQAMIEICNLILSGSADIESYSSDGVSVTLKESAGLDEKIYEIIRRNVQGKYLYLGADKDDK